MNTAASCAGYGFVHVIAELGRAIRYKSLHVVPCGRAAIPKTRSLGQIDYAKIERAQNFFGWQYLTVQCFRYHTNIYTSLPCERTLASRSFYFRTEHLHNVFQVKYSSHVEYALKNFAVCLTYPHDIIRFHRVER
jgi:hypothetical protein